MRLLTKTMLYFLLAMIPLLAGGGFLLFRQFGTQLNERADKELVYEEVQWIQYLETHTGAGSSFVLRSPDLLIFPAQKEPTPFPEITDAYGTKAKENVQIPFRQLAHVVDINGIPYQIVIRKSQEQKLALVANITSIMLTVFAGLFLATLLFNWIISKQLWQPFRESLQKVRKLELQKMETVHFGQTGTEEFNELNVSLNAMVRKIRSDFLNMKEFTENAAHEMQTPLAVAQSKLELLLQDGSLHDLQVQNIAQAAEALGRLSKLNQSLLLLAKIENNQFEATQEISLTDITKKYLRLFEEISKDKKLSIETAFEDDFTATIHPFLADSLVSNLLGNAIKYGSEEGRISIRVTSNEYCITNTSDLPAIDQDKLFQRFKTAGHEAANATGLGLSIVKRIVDASNLSVSYSHDKDSHCFCIRKKNF